VWWRIPVRIFRPTLRPDSTLMSDCNIDLRSQVAN
jgi:hypothetical protein